MKRKNFPGRKEARQKEAAERNKARKERGDAGQLAGLESAGIGGKEAARLKAKIEAHRSKKAKKESK